MEELERAIAELQEVIRRIEAARSRESVDPLAGVEGDEARALARHDLMLLDAEFTASIPYILRVEAMLALRPQ